MFVLLLDLPCFLAPLYGFFSFTDRTLAQKAVHGYCNSINEVLIEQSRSTDASAIRGCLWNDDSFNVLCRFEKKTRNKSGA